MRNFVLFGAALLVSAGISAQTSVVEEGFEGGSLPADWSLSQNEASVGWEFGNAGSLSSQYLTFPDHTSFAASNDDANGGPDGTTNLADEDRLITPELDMSDMAAAGLTFSTYNPELYGSDGTVEVSTDGGENWEMVFDTPANEDQWMTYTVSLTEFAGDSLVMVAFRHNDSGVWASGVGVDDVEIYIPPANDAGIDNAPIEPYVEIGTDVEITATVVNYGSDEITSLEFNWNAGGEDHTQTLSDLDIAPFESTVVTHDETYSVTDYTGADITVSVSNPNGNEDANSDNNSITSGVLGLDFIPEKRVLVEEGTGTWCGWCPRGFVNMEMLSEDYPETTVLVAVHNGDPMADPEYDSGLGLSGFPGGAIDRLMSGTDPSDFEDAVIDRLQVTRVASVDVSHFYNEVNSKVTVTVSATFATNISDADYSLNGILIEDGVTGTGSDWDQHNYYAGGVNGPMDGWEDLSDVVPAEDMVYNEVGRAVMAGFDGDASAIPSEVTAGETYTTSFTTTVEESWDPANMRVAGMLTDNSNGEVINADYSENGMVLGLDRATANAGFSVSPNPATTQATLELNLNKASEVSIDIRDAAGRQVSAKNYGTVSGGKQYIRVFTTHMPAGMYMVRATVDGSSVVRKLVVK